VLEKIPEDARIIPGHGPLSTVEDLRAYHGMLLETTGIVRKWIAEGKSLDEAKAAGFSEEYKSWGEGFISEEEWIETVYGELSGS
jgi:hypothetical protein